MSLQTPRSIKPLLKEHSSLDQIAQCPVHPSTTSVGLQYLTSLTVDLRSSPDFVPFFFFNDCVILCCLADSNFSVRIFFLTWNLVLVWRLFSYCGWRQNQESVFHYHLPKTTHLKVSSDANNISLVHLLIFTFLLILCLFLRDRDGFHADHLALSLIFSGNSYAWFCFNRSLAESFVQMCRASRWIFSVFLTSTSYQFSFLPQTHLSFAHGRYHTSSLTATLLVTELWILQWSL